MIKGRRWPDGRPFVGFAPGDFTFGYGDGKETGDPPKWFRFGCPRGRGECMVALKPQTLGNGASWTFDGNRDAPTLTPSINCLVEKDGKPLAGCGWHGWVKNGEFTDS